MMKYIDADRLREKIAEQMESLPREVGRGAGTITSKGYGMMQAFQIMRSIIDSLQQEQLKVECNELEKISEKYAEKLDISKGWFDGCEIDELIKESYKAGAEWQKEQMMEEAVEGVVYRYDSYQRIATAIIVDINRELLGNKVKVIIVKEDG